MMKLKTVFLISFLLIFLLNSVSITAQTRRQTKPKPTTSDNSAVPEIKDFAFVVNIDKNSNVTLSVQKTEDSTVLANASNAKALTDFVTKFSKMQNSRTAIKPTDLLDPIYIVRADSSLNYSEVIKVIQAFRVSSKQKIKIEISKGFYAFIPLKPEKTDINSMKPNPLTLVVELKENQTLSVNSQEEGSLNNPSPLMNVMKQIFKDREDNGVFRSSTNEVEKTVFVKVPASAKFADVIKLVEALRDSGATPIGLVIDGDDFPRTIMIMETP